MQSLVVAYALILVGDLASVTFALLLVGDLASVAFALLLVSDLASVAFVSDRSSSAEGSFRLRERK